MASPYVLALLASFLAWLSLSAWVVVGRMAHDRRVAALRRGSGGRRRSWRIVARATAGRPADDRLADALTHAALANDEWGVLEAALGRVSWRSVEAARILARADHPRTLEALERLLASGDEEIAAAAATILGEIDSEPATSLLVEALRSGACPARWISALLESRQVPVSSLKPLLGDTRPGVREAAIRLLGRTDPGTAVDADLLQLCDDPSPDVRAAAAAALGRRGGTGAVTRLESLLDDETWFVQVQAARALGRLHSLASAEPLAHLLASRQWWVRQAAKDALVELGRGVREPLAAFLDHSDPFARNSCAEVLQNVGVVDQLLAEAEGTSSGGRQGSVTLLAKILAAGGARLEDAALSCASPGLRAELAARASALDASTSESRAA
jgi:HEAT repeat protein